MSKQILFKYLVLDTKSDSQREINYLVGEEERVANFLISMTNGELYKASVTDLYQQAQNDPVLMASLNKIFALITEKIEGDLDKPLMRPSQTFGKKE